MRPHPDAVPLDYALATSHVRTKAATSPGTFADDPDIADPGVELPALATGVPTTALAWRLADRACTEMVPSARLELPPDHHVRLGEAEHESFIAAWSNNSIRPLLGLLPGDRLTALGVDFARSAAGDLTVIAPLLERQDLVKRCPWWVELRGVPYDEQWEKLIEAVEARRDAAERDAKHTFLALKEEIENLERSIAPQGAEVGLAIPLSGDVLHVRQVSYNGRNVITVLGELKEKRVSLVLHHTQLQILLVPVMPIGAPARVLYLVKTDEAHK